MKHAHQSSLFVYLLLAFGLCWLFWLPRAYLSHNEQIPGAALMALHILGAFGPAAAALIMTRSTGGRVGLLKLLKPYTHWRVDAGWYILAIAFRPVIWIMALGVYILMGWKTASFQPVDWPFFTAYLLSQPLIVGFGEELGWMGFAYPWLRSRFGFLASGLLLGVIWGLWHLPMFFTVGDSQFGSALILFVLKLTALRLVMALMFEATGSLLMPAIFHVSMNVLTELVPLSPNDPLAFMLLVFVTLGMVVTHQLHKQAPHLSNVAT